MLSTAAAAIALPTGCSEASSSAPTRRRTSGSLVLDAEMTSSSCILPEVMVPVLSNTMVSISRVDSKISGPLMRIPNCAPRPVPTSSAVGVASPSAHGQAIINTETAALKAVSVPPPVSSQ
ncbi:unannotated protein [freshwater metagenome]|uniref:Unannotated protein n=1 Tax=freshwater metagenome TaxID=449393 RepID=A0A6J6UYP0_9ZZZZ